MEIRKATQSDIPGMLALLRQVGQVHHEIRPDIFRSGAQKYDETALLSLLTDPMRPIFVATKGAFVAGYCFCILKESQEDPVLTDRKELYIDDLCVDENHRGKGIAKTLYSHTCAYAKSIGCRFVTLNVWQGNDNAMAFYQSLGMTQRSITMETVLEETTC